MKVKSRRGRKGKLRRVGKTAPKQTRATRSDGGNSSEAPFQSTQATVAQFESAETFHESPTRGASESFDFTIAHLTEARPANHRMEVPSRTMPSKPTGALMHANRNQENLRPLSARWTGHTLREAPPQNLERAIESLTRDLEVMRRHATELMQANDARHMQPFQYGVNAKSREEQQQLPSLAETPFIEALQSRLAKVEVEFFSVRHELGETQARLSQKVQRIACLEDQLDTLMRERAKYRHDVECVSDQFEAAASQLKAPSETNDLHNQIETLSRAVDDMRRRAEAAEQTADAAQSENADLIQELRSKLDDMAEAHALQFRRNAELDQEIVTQRQERARLHEALHQAERKLTTSALTIAIDQQNVALQAEESMALKNSRSWKWSAPIRAVVSLLAKFEGAIARRRHPNPLFDAHYYIEKYPDVRGAGIDAYVHYRRYGAAEGRDPNPMFDTSWYCERYPDVMESGLNPLDHYYLLGAKEGRDPHPLFSTSWYKQSHPDLAMDDNDLLLDFLNSNSTGKEAVLAGAGIR